MYTGGITEPDRTGFAGSAVTDRNDDIGRKGFVIIAALADQAFGGDILAFEVFQRARKYHASRLTTGAAGINSALRNMTCQCFCEDAATAVMSTDKKYFHRSDISNTLTILPD